MWGPDLELGATLLADALLVDAGAAVADAGGLATHGADEHDVRDVDLGGLVDDAALLVHLVRTRGLLDDGNALDENLAFLFFFNDPATTEIYTNLNTLSLHDALPNLQL